MLVSDSIIKSLDRRIYRAERNIHINYFLIIVLFSVLGAFIGALSTYISHNNKHGDVTENITDSTGDCGIQNLVNPVLQHPPDKLID